LSRLYSVPVDSLLKAKFLDLGFFVDDGPNEGAAERSLFFDNLRFPTDDFGFLLAYDY
jgi:hypothetical protein